MLEIVINEDAREIKAGIKTSRIYGVAFYYGLISVTIICGGAHLYVYGFNYRTFNIPHFYKEIALK